MNKITLNKICAQVLILAGLLGVFTLSSYACKTNYLGPFTSSSSGGVCTPISGQNGAAGSCTKDSFTNTDGYCVNDVEDPNYQCKLTPDNKTNSQTTYTYQATFDARHTYTGCSCINGQTTTWGVRILIPGDGECPPKNNEK